MHLTQLMFLTPIQLAIQLTIVLSNDIGDAVPLWLLLAGLAVGITHAVVTVRLIKLEAQLHDISFTRMLSLRLASAVDWRIDIIFEKNHNVIDFAANDFKFNMKE